MAKKPPAAAAIKNRVAETPPGLKSPKGLKSTPPGSAIDIDLASGQKLTFAWISDSQPPSPPNRYRFWLFFNGPNADIEKATPFQSIPGIQSNPPQVLGPFNAPRVVTI